MVATKSAAAATVSGGRSFEEKLAICQARIADLESEISDVDEALATGGLDDVRALNAQRRAASDDLAFLRERLPALEREAANELWQNRRDALNAEWPALVQRRVDIANQYNAAIDTLVKLHTELVQCHNEQVGTLSRYGDLDRVVVGRTPILPVIQGAQREVPVQPVVQKIDVSPANTVYRDKVLP